MSEELEFLQRIAQRMDSAGIEYMVSGSVALSFYAQPRMTRDIDIVVALNESEAKTFVALFEHDAYIDLESVRDAIRRRDMFNIIDNKTVIKADFIVRKDEAFRREEFARKREIDVAGVKVWVVSPEDLVLSKLLWSKASRSEMQRNDIKNLLVSSAELDRAYLEKWASALGVGEDLREIEQ